VRVDSIESSSLNFSRSSKTGSVAPHHGKYMDRAVRDQ